MENVKIIKIGGNIIDNAKILNSFLEDFSNIKGFKVLVHGGGKVATQLSNKMGVAVKIKNGRRITDQETLEIITMVYAGKINKNIVATLQSNNCNAIGFSGADGNTIKAIKRPVQDIDYEFAGDVEKVETSLLKVLLNNNNTPVFCAITHDGKGQLLNTNADTIASALAIGLSQYYKTELYYCFEKKGVLHDIFNKDSVINKINLETYQTLLNNGTIADGMLLKLTNCFNALQNGVEKVCIGKPEMLFDKEAIFTTIQK